MQHDLGLFFLGSYVPIARYNRLVYICVTSKDGCCRHIEPIDDQLCFCRVFATLPHGRFAQWDFSCRLADTYRTYMDKYTPQNYDAFVSCLHQHHY
jgi:hypothetical protein